MKSSFLAALFLATLVVSATLVSAAEAEQSLVQTQTTVPADLQALEQKMAQLHINSERFSIAMNVGLEAGKETLPLVIGGSGIASVSPSEAQMTIGLFGAGEEARVIGDRLYRHEPLVAEFDGNRPWVVSTHADLEQSLGASGVGVVGAAGASAGTFADLVEAIGKADSVLEVGPAIIEGKQTTEFRLTLSSTGVVKGEFAEALQEPVQRKVASIELDLFIGPEGLPVRTGVAVRAEHQTVTMTVDILAVEVPVEVKVPPARATITEARLKRLERERSKCHLYGRRRRRKLAVCKGTEGVGPLILPPS